MCDPHCRSFNLRIDGFDRFKSNLFYAFWTRWDGYYNVCSFFFPLAGNVSIFQLDFVSFSMIVWTSLTHRAERDTHVSSHFWTLSHISSGTFLFLDSVLISFWKNTFFRFFGRKDFSVLGNVLHTAGRWACSKSITVSSTLLSTALRSTFHKQARNFSRWFSSFVRTCRQHVLFARGVSFCFSVSVKRQKLPNRVNSCP